MAVDIWMLQFVGAQSEEMVVPAFLRCTLESMGGVGAQHLKNQAEVSLLECPKSGMAFETVGLTLILCQPNELLSRDEFSYMLARSCMILGYKLLC